MAAVVQFAPVSLQPETNARRMAQFIDEAAGRGAKLVVFPELADAGHCRWPANRAELQHVQEFTRAARPVPGPTTDTLAEAARRHEVWVVAGILEADQSVDGIVHNAAVLIGPDGVIAGRHRKVSNPIQEAFYFVQGNRLDVFDTPVGKLGINICYDVLQPENFRVQTVLGMQVGVAIWASAEPNPPTIAPDSPVHNGFPARDIRGFPIVRAVENVIYVLSCTRVGRDEFTGAHYWGQSQIIDPVGNVLAEATSDDEQILTAEIDLDLVRLARGVRPMLKDRNPRLYGPLVATDE